MSDDFRIGIDVGGTNTDAVVLDSHDRIRAWTKAPTTTDVSSGIHAAISAVLAELGDQASHVRRVMLGTTHATNAILERRGLGRVAAVRIGAPATTSVPPLTGWPADLRAAACPAATVVRGGYLVDGHPLAPFDRDAVAAFLESVAGEIDAVAVTGMFSPAFRDQELETAEIAAKVLGSHVPVTMSHELGSLGLIERENAAVLNASLYAVAGDVTRSLGQALADHGLDVTCYFAQNDGTLMAVDHAERYPVLTIGSGPANSIRGAAYLSGLDDAIVVDVGGTSSDFGVLRNGFPRESALAANIGGVSTNFRMPDVLAVAIGGGTILSGTPESPVVGPQSVGYRIRERGLVFGGDTPTLTDAAVAAGRTEIAGHRLSSRKHGELFSAALRESDRCLADAIDSVALGRHDKYLVAVGGGAFLVPDDLDGAARVVRPDHGQVANAVGAAIALASGWWETIVPTGEGRRRAVDEACDVARQRAVHAGAMPDGVEIVEIVEVPLSYLPKPSVRLSVKAAGPLARL
ncbi:hydantoinase/oxoprolinase N-terminal domain-containing protein [Nocardioides ginsengisoli]|uniref:Hydantoinase/oxoprolinase N-terminal domain-containing protein n=1 Tax=Nocardioides ginsengisoli TaxID=363868 RepID=A0ABW3VX65_9ACTN